MLTYWSFNDPVAFLSLSGTTVRWVRRACCRGRCRTCATTPACSTAASATPSTLASTGSKRPHTEQCKNIPARFWEWMAEIYFAKVQFVGGKRNILRVFSKLSRNVFTQLCTERHSQKGLSKVSWTKYWPAARESKMRDSCNLRRHFLIFGHPLESTVRS